MKSVSVMGWCGATSSFDEVYADLLRGVRRGVPRGSGTIL